MEATVRLQNAMGFAETVEANAAYGNQMSSTYAVTALQPQWFGTPPLTRMLCTPRSRASLASERTASGLARFDCPCCASTARLFVAGPRAGDGQMEGRLCHTNKSFQARRKPRAGLPHHPAALLARDIPPMRCRCMWLMMPRGAEACAGTLALQHHSSFTEQLTGVSSTFVKGPHKASSPFQGMLAPRNIY